MHILFLTQVIPYPPDAGPKIKTWNVIRWLVESGCQVTLVSFARPQEAAAVQELRGMGVEVVAVPLRRRRLLEPWYGLVSILRGRPFLVERDDRKAFRAAVAGLISAQPVDVIHADQVSMAQFALAAGGRSPSMPALVFDAHNAVWVIFERAAQNAAWYWKPFLSFEARRMKRYEGMLVRSFDRTLAVSDTDRRSLEEAAGEGSIESRRPISVVPIGVDTQALSPVQRQPGSLKILTLGTLRYPPNAEGIRWFIREVFPLVKARVPGASLTIIGAHPPADFQTLADLNPENYHVPGYVPDLALWFAQAALVVVPVQVGGGMRVRILEAFARGMPVVTTTVGLEGIAARASEDVLVEDDPAGFAAAVVRILENPALQQALSRRGRQVAELYDWKAVLKEMGDIYAGFEEQTAGADADAAVLRSLMAGRIHAE